LPARWLFEFRPPTGGCALVCVPYAGGSASVFETWQRKASLLDIMAVQLPGHANRIVERPVGSLTEIVDGIMAELSDVPGEYALFGHSMGALVVFELARRIRDTGGPGPKALFVSGYPAPDAPLAPPVYHLPRDELIEWLLEIGGIDQSLAREHELLDVLLPALRADLAVVDTYRHRPAPPLPWPIRVLLGADDPSCTLADACGWRAHSTGGFGVTVFPGDHFYLHGQAEWIVELIEQDLLTRGGVRA
jgi:medium-chain acyl-[acyl-carrier-protein] hydrolase